MCSTGHCGVFFIQVLVVTSFSSAAHLKQQVKVIIVGQHVPDVGDRRGHSTPHDVVGLILKIHGEIKGVAIIHNISPDW